MSAISPENFPVRFYFRMELLFPNQYKLIIDSKIGKHIILCITKILYIKLRQIYDILIKIAAKNNNNLYDVVQCDHVS